MTSSVIGFKAKWFAGGARALAGVLAATILLLGLLATNGTFHQAFHQDGHAADHGCVLCLFAQGQIDSPEAQPAIPALVRPGFEPTPRVESLALVDFTYLAFPSRAPPASAALLLAVA